jgi:hypothetical protein
LALYPRARKQVRAQKAASVDVKEVVHRLIEEYPEAVERLQQHTPEN